jgi:hypothetical protein
MDTHHILYAMKEVATMLVKRRSRTMMSAREPEGSNFSSPKSHSAPNVMYVVLPAGGPRAM